MAHDGLESSPQAVKELFRTALTDPVQAFSVSSAVLEFLSYRSIFQDVYRLEKGFERYGLAITRQNMANWMIRLGI